MNTATEARPGAGLVARAPTRIDLAGGTLDLWPLYLFLDRPTTVNLAIDLFAEARLETSPGARVSLASEDLGAASSWDWESFAEAPLRPELALHGKLVRHFAPPAWRSRHPRAQQSLSLTTQAKSPAGAGLGGSSALAVAIAAALDRWSGDADPSRPSLLDPASGERLVDLVRDVETTTIRVPAGMQDYYAAYRGGLLEIRWGAVAPEWRRLSERILEEASARIALFYSGQSRNSGINNWALFKSLIDGEAGVRDAFQSISDAARGLAASLESGDWKGAGEAIAAEWAVRRGLARSISTPAIDSAMAKARELGLAAGKICGAGGGGCFFLWSDREDPELLDRLEREIAPTGARRLRFTGVPGGVEVSKRI